MVRIRLARGGAKKRPFYHIVVTDKRNQRDGRYIERLGFFNPIAIGGETPLKLDRERIEYWRGQGAVASERVTHLIKHFDKNGIEEAPSRAAPPKSKPKPKPAAPKAEATEEAAPAEESAPAEAAAPAEEAAPAEDAAPAADEAPAEDAGSESDEQK